MIKSQILLTLQRSVLQIINKAESKAYQFKNKINKSRCKGCCIGKGCSSFIYFIGFIWLFKVKSIPFCYPMKLQLRTCNSQDCIAISLATYYLFFQIKHAFRIREVT